MSEQVGIDAIQKALANKETTTEVQDTQKVETPQVKAQETPKAEEPAVTTEAPKAETPAKEVETSSLSSAEAKAPPTEKPLTETPVLSWNDDLVKLAQENGYVQKEDDSEFISKLKELERNNVNITDLNFLSEVQRDYDKYDVGVAKDAAEVIRLGKKLSDPTWTDREVEIELEDKYPTLYSSFDKDEIDFDSDSEFEAAKKSFNSKRERELIKLTREAKTHLGTLKENQRTIQLPSGETPEQTKEREGRQLEIASAYKDYTTQKVANLESVTQKVDGYDKDFTINVDESERGDLLSFMQDPKNLLLKYHTDNPQNPLSDDLLTDLKWANPEWRGKALKVMLEQAFANKESEIIDGSKNQKMPSSQASNTETSKDLMTQIGTQYLERKK